MGTGTEFKQELAALLNKYSIDNQVGVPDFILAAHLENTIVDLHHLQSATKRWREGQPQEPKYRDAKTGAYVTEEYALAHPDTTVKES